MSEDLKTIALSMLKSRSIFYMATIDRGIPRVRPMTCLCAEGFKIWTCSHRKTGKVQQLQANNHVEACFMDDQNRLLRIAGTVQMFEDEQSWAHLPCNSQSMPMLEDPDYILLAIEPTEVRLTHDWSLNYQTLSIL